MSAAENTDNEILSIEELLSHAHRMEAEASERYAELADQMEVHNNDEVAALFRKLSEIEGKHIAQVYYVKGEDGNVIRYRQPGDSEFSRLTLAEVEQRLDKLKREHGKNLYVKIIIPEESGLAYNEAWEFMRKLLVKYDYYYQD